MFSEKGILDLKKIFMILLDKKYSIIILTLIIVLATNIYVQNFKDTVKIERTIILNLGKKNSLINNGKLIKSIKIFRSKYDNYENLSLKCYYFNKNFIFKIIYYGNNKNIGKSKINSIVNIFTEEIIRSLINRLDQKKEKLILEIGYIIKKQNIHKKRITMIDSKLSEYLIENIDLSNLDLTISSSEKLISLKKLINSELNDLKKHKSKIKELNNLKKLGDITIDDLLIINNSINVYKVNKIKFFIFSLLFSLIMSMTFVILFYNHKEKI